MVRIIEKRELFSSLFNKFRSGLFVQSFFLLKIDDALFALLVCPDRQAIVKDIRVALRGEVVGLSFEFDHIQFANFHFYFLPFFLCFVI